MRSSAAFILIAFAGLGLSLSGGCGENTIEGQTRPTVLSINGGTPLHADVFLVDTTAAGGGFIPEEAVEVTFSNPPSHDLLDISEVDPYGHFIFTSYTVNYHIVQLLPGGGSFSTPNLPSVTNPMQLIVRVNEEVTTAIVLAPASLKLEPPIVDIMPGGTAPSGEAVVRAEIVFTGHALGSDNEQTIEAEATILFANYADED